MQKRVGILGAGQLAQMMVEAAQTKLGFDPLIFTDDLENPALKRGKNYVLGKLSDRDKLQAFLRRCDVVAFENEFLDTKTLLQALEGGADPFRPSLKTLAALQDKLSQKRIFQNLGLASARFREFSRDPKTLRLELSETAKIFGNSYVLKWSRQGYDGKGVLLLCDQSETSLEKAENFVNEGSARNAEVYAEERIQFTRELALLSAFSSHSDFVFYPLVVSEQDQGICDRVIGPATSLGVHSQLEHQARACAEILAREFDLVGVFAIEFFEDANGHLLINEVAPRVHNSGHFSQDASTCSQFENHLRGVLGLPLGSTHSSEFFAMCNLLGPSKAQGSARQLSFPPAP